MLNDLLYSFFQTKVVFCKVNIILYFIPEFHERDPFGWASERNQNISLKASSKEIAKSTFEACEIIT
jgi:hypothetical protein